MKKQINNVLPIADWQLENRIRNIINHLNAQLQYDVSEYLNQPKIVQLIWTLDEELSK